MMTIGYIEYIIIRQQESQEDYSLDCEEKGNDDKECREGWEDDDTS